MAHGGFDGIFPAIVSPRDADGGFGVAAFERLIDRFYVEGAQGLYVCGNTGEGYLMSAADRKLAAEVAVKMSAQCGKVIVHVGAPAESDAVELAAHAASQGVDGISSLPPYVQGYGFTDVLAYYTAIAEAGAGLPVFVYYIPVVTHRSFALDEMERLLSIRDVAGLKFTDHNLYLMEGILNGPSRPHVFNGHDEVLLAGLAMGAQAGIGGFYNVMPGLFVKIYEAVQSGDFDSARGLQQEVNRVIRIGLAYGGTASIREILRWQGVDCGNPIPPTRPLGEDVSRRMRADLEAAEVGILDG
jgi:N-acetylneuraminate lyase